MSALLGKGVPLARVDPRALRGCLALLALLA